MEAQQRGSRLDTTPVGLKQPGSFNGPSLLAKTGFRWDFNPQSPGDTSVLLALPEPAYREEGGQLFLLFPCPEDAGR